MAISSRIAGTCQPPRRRCGGSPWPSRPERPRPLRPRLRAVVGPAAGRAGDGLLDRAARWKRSAPGRAPAAAASAAGRCALVDFLLPAHITGAGGRDAALRQRPALADRLRRRGRRSAPRRSSACPSARGVAPLPQPVEHRDRRRRCCSSPGSASPRPTSSPRTSTGSATGSCRWSSSLSGTFLNTRFTGQGPADPGLARRLRACRRSSRSQVHGTPLVAALPADDRHGLPALHVLHGDRPGHDASAVPRASSPSGAVAAVYGLSWRSTSSSACSSRC